MKFRTKNIIISAVAAGLITPITAYATNGAWLIGYGGHSRAMGGTGVADNRGGMAAEQAETAPAWHERNSVRQWTAGAGLEIEFFFHVQRL